MFVLLHLPIFPQHEIDFSWDDRGKHSVSHSSLSGSVGVLGERSPPFSLWCGPAAAVWWSLSTRPLRLYAGRSCSRWLLATTRMPCCCHLWTINATFTFPARRHISAERRLRCQQGSVVLCGRHRSCRTRTMYLQSERRLFVHFGPSLGHGKKRRARSCDKTRGPVFARFRQENRVTSATQRGVSDSGSACSYRLTSPCDDSYASLRLNRVSLRPSAHR